jgi:DNA invertase Pin-like site-specific DNA recombinase
MRRIGYARVSTGEQSTAAQAAELRAAGCTEVQEEQRSGGDRDRPVLARILAGIGPGDVLMVVRIDRLARSLAHLLEVIAALEARGARFRSLRDPIDTGSPQGKFTLQVLGAAAEFERALIRERTKAGLAAARAEGRRGGNPGLVAGDAATRRRLAAARHAAFLERLGESAQDWVPEVRRLRPHLPWADVLRVVNARSGGWTEARLKRAARAYVAEGLLPAEVLSRAPRPPADARRLALVAALAGTEPPPSLRAISARLEALHEPAPRGGRRWPLATVASLLAQARAQGLLPKDPGESGATAR